MSFLILQDQLREHIRARIRRRELTGSGLARAAGFPQGHLSNFLNFRRGLSLESMDRLLDTLGIGILDLVSTEDLRRQAVLPAGADDLEELPVVAREHATRARFTSEQILETRGFSRSFLRRLRPSEAHHRADWVRFVVVKLEAHGARAIFSAEVAAASLLLDRHYNSLDSYRRHQPNLYAVNFGEQVWAGYLCAIADQLVLRPGNVHQPLESVRVAPGRSYAQYIIGRVCHVGLEV